jgi:hypothetical protein
MYDARKHYPFTSAIAGGMVVRVGGSLLTTGLPDMAHRTASFPIRRDVPR